MTNELLEPIRQPNAMVAAVHDRIPVILRPEHYQWWLQPDRFEPQFLQTLLRPYPAEGMACVRVSKLVNSARFDSPECLLPDCGR
jgi:putative SOS response-associated peptidase YedK